LILMVIFKSAKYTDYNKRIMTQYKKLYTIETVFI